MKRHLIWLVVVTIVTATCSFATSLSQERSQDLVKPGPFLGVRTLAFSPDGRMLAAGASDAQKKDEVAIWDATTLKARAVRQLDNKVATVAFSPDSKTLAVGTFSENCYLLDAETGNVKATLSGHGKAARYVAFAPDGNTLAVASADHDVHLWDWRAGERVRTLKGHTTEVSQVAFSPDGKLLASSGGSTCLWETDSGKLLHQWDRGYPIAFDPKGKWLACGRNDSSVTLRDLKDYQKTVASFDGIYPYFFLSIHPFGKTFAACSGFDKEVRVFRLDLGQATAAEEKRIGELMALWNDDRMDVREKASQDLAKLGSMTKPLLRRALKESPSAEVRVRAREVLKGLVSPKPIARLTGHSEIAMRCVFSADGQTLATAARDGLVLLWDTSTYQSKGRLTWPPIGR